MTSDSTIIKKSSSAVSEPTETIAKDSLFHSKLTKTADLPITLSRQPWTKNARHAIDTRSPILSLEEEKVTEETESSQVLATSSTYENQTEEADNTDVMPGAVRVPGISRHPTSQQTLVYGRENGEEDRSLDNVTSIPNSVVAAVVDEDQLFHELLFRRPHDLVEAENVETVMAEPLDELNLDQINGSDVDSWHQGLETGQATGFAKDNSLQNQGNSELPRRLFTSRRIIAVVIVAIVVAVVLLGVLVFKPPDRPGSVATAAPSAPTAVPPVFSLRKPPTTKPVLPPVVPPSVSPTINPVVSPTTIPITQLAIPGFISDCNGNGGACACGVGGDGIGITMNSFYGDNNDAQVFGCGGAFHLDGTSWDTQWNGELSSTNSSGSATSVGFTFSQSASFDGWEGCCTICGYNLQLAGKITDGWYCEKDFFATGIYLKGKNTH